MDYSTTHYDYKVVGHTDDGPLFKATRRLNVRDDDLMPWLFVLIYVVPLVTVVLMAVF